MRPDEMRAALVESLCRALCHVDCYNVGKGSEGQCSKCDLWSDYAEPADAALTAIESKLAEIGAKITVREPSEAMLSTEIDSEIPAHEYEPADPLMWPQRRWVWKCLYDAAPTTPWEESTQCPD